MDLRTRTFKTRPIETSGRRDKEPPTFPKGRICAAAHRCPGAELSIYNPGPNCNLCSPRGKRMLSSAEELTLLMAQTGIAA
jgi:hypothetical protein